MTNKELSAWLAAHVMEWKFHYAGIGSWWEAKNKFVAYDDLWRPTESISDAMMVVEKMEDREYLFGLITTNDLRCASFRHKSGTSRYTECMSRHKTPLAISLVAKKAVEGEEDKS